MDSLKNIPEGQPVEIVELHPDQWEILRNIKIKSLEQEPIAFEDQESGFKKYRERQEATWRETLQGKRKEGTEGISITVFAKTGDEYVGMVSAVTDGKESEAAMVHHMFVDQKYRGKKIGKKLLQGLIDRLKHIKGIKRVELMVIDTQEPAIGLYKSLGFKELEKVAGVKRGDKSWGEIKMELILSSEEDSKIQV